MSLPELPEERVLNHRVGYNADQLRAYGQQCYAAGAAEDRAKCGGENCMGRKINGHTTWVTEAARDAAVAAERERCAKLCDGIQTMHEGVADAEQSTEHNSIALGAEVCAAAIRSAKPS